MAGDDHSRRYRLVLLAEEIARESIDDHTDEQVAAIVRVLEKNEETIRSDFEMWVEQFQRGR